MLKLMIEETDRPLVYHGGVPCKTFRGKTAGGLECEVTVAAIGVPPGDQAALEAERGAGAEGDPMAPVLPPGSIGVQFGIAHKLALPPSDPGATVHELAEIHRASLTNMWRDVINQIGEHVEPLGIPQGLVIATGMAAIHEFLAMMHAVGWVRASGRPHPDPSKN